MTPTVSLMEFISHFVRISCSFNSLFRRNAGAVFSISSLDKYLAALLNFLPTSQINQLNARWSPLICLQLNARMSAALARLLTPTNWHAPSPPTPSLFLSRVACFPFAPIVSSLTLDARPIISELMIFWLFNSSAHWRVWKRWARAMSSHTIVALLTLRQVNYNFN